MEFVSGNIFVRPNLLACAGDCINGHKHNFDHTSFFIRGSFNVVATLPDGATREVSVKAGDHLLIKADVTHKITALEDDCLFHCIYSHRRPQGDVSVEETGWREAYV